MNTQKHYHPLSAVVIIAHKGRLVQLWVCEKQAGVPPHSACSALRDKGVINVCPLIGSNFVTRHLQVFTAGPVLHCTAVLYQDWKTSPFDLAHVIHIFMGTSAKTFTFTQTRHDILELSEAKFREGGTKNAERQKFPWRKNRTRRPRWKVPGVYTKNLRLLAPELDEALYARWDLLLTYIKHNQPGSCLALKRSWEGVAEAVCAIYGNFTAEWQ